MAQLNGYGMAFAQAGQQVANTQSYTTQQDRLQFNLNNPNQALYDLVTLSEAGTNLTVTYGQSAQETLLVVNHGLGYAPQAFVTMLVYAAGTTPNYQTGAYALEEYVFDVGVIGIDYVYYAVDDDNLYIIHEVNLSGSTPPGTYTSTAADYGLQVKYLICNNAYIHTQVLY